MNTQRTAKARILVIDDEASVRDILRDFLSLEGYEVAMSDSAQAGIEALQQRNFDIVLTDLEMPGGSGIEVLRAIRERKRGPAAILMTGYGTVESAIAAMKEGAYDYILKPFQIEELTQLIGKALDHRRLADENLRLKEAISFYRYSEALSAASTAEEILDTLVSFVTGEIEPAGLAIWRLQESDWHLVADWFDIDGKSRSARDLVGAFDDVHMLKLLHSGRPQLCDEQEARRAFPELDERVHSCLFAPLRSSDRITGVIAAFSLRERPPFTEGDRKTLQLMANRAATSIENMRLNANLERTFIQTIQSLIGALEAKDEYTRGHSERVMRWAMIIAELIGLPPDQREHLRRGALLHDIGKIGLDLESLNKPEPLTNDEYDRFKLHPVVGKRILAPVEFLKPAIPGVMHHHERWDGNGYPFGLAGEEIPLPGRILAIADSFEVMITDRVYRKALSLDEARAELKRCRGTQFDPKLIDIFVSWLDQFGSADELPIQGGRRNASTQTDANNTLTAHG